MGNLLSKAVNSVMKRRFMKRSFPQAKPAVEHFVDCRQVGYRDAQESGWFQGATGELVSGFQIRPEDTLIDVGCGDGGASMFAAARGAEVIATDIDAAQVAQVADKLKRSKARAYQAVVSDSDPLPIESERATRVICLEVLEHVEDPRKFLRELVRVGKPGSQYLIAVPDESGERLQQKIAPRSYWTKPNHLHIYSRDQLDALVVEAGLTIEHRTHCGFFWCMWWTLFWAADQQFNEPEGPLLANWTRTWHALMSTPKGDHVRKALDEFMPKSQVIIARKAA